MVTVRRILFGTVAAGALLALSGCPSPLLSAIKDTIAKFPFTATSYTFLRQWGNPTPQYSFGNCVVKVDTAGYVYVADDTFRIRKFSPAGALQRTYDVAAATGIAGTVYDMAFDSSGNMYVATDSSTTPILKYSLTGARLNWTPGATITRAAGVAVDSSGNLLVLDSSQLKVLPFTSSGTALTAWDGTGLHGGGTAFSSPGGITVDKNGWIYVSDTNGIRQYYSTGDWYFLRTVTVNALALSSPRGITADTSLTPTFYIADSGNSRIVKTDFSTSSAFGSFTSLASAAVDNSGNVYAADVPISGSLENVGRVQKYNSAGTLQATWGGTALTGNGQFTAPAGVAFDSSGNVYVCDTGNNRIQKFDSMGNYLGQTTAPIGPWYGSIAVDSAGNVYVPDQTGGQVQVFNSSLVHQTNITTAGMTSPSSVTFDSAGNIYVADLGGKIYIFDPNGYTTHVPATIGTSGLADGQLAYPSGVAVDSAGNVYAADFFFLAGQPHAIQKFDKNGNFVKAWGTSGTGNGQFSYPMGIAADKYDHIYVSDFVNRRIEKFDSDGNYLGQWGGVGVGNGTFGWPMDVAIDGSGNAVVSDATTNIVQLFAPAP